LKKDVPADTKSDDTVKTAVNEVVAPAVDDTVKTAADEDEKPSIEDISENKITPPEPEEKDDDKTVMDKIKGLYKYVKSGDIFAEIFHRHSNIFNISNLSCKTVKGQEKRFANTSFKLKSLNKFIYMRQNILDSGNINSFMARIRKSAVKMYILMHKVDENLHIRFNIEGEDYDAGVVALNKYYPGMEEDYKNDRRNRIGSNPEITAMEKEDEEAHWSRLDKQIADTVKEEQNMLDFLFQEIMNKISVLSIDDLKIHVHPSETDYKNDRFKMAYSAYFMVKGPNPARQYMFSDYYNLRELMDVIGKTMTELITEFEVIPKPKMRKIICAICHEGGDVQEVENCNHKFHEECLYEWCKTQYKRNNAPCPVCRKDLY
jgi:hypothetical protein